MSCMHSGNLHANLKNLDRDFVEFWYEYFQSSGSHVRDLPIKYYLSAMDLVHLCDLTSCKCRNLLGILYKSVTYRCKYCQKTFSSQRELMAHVSKYKSEAKRYECVFCVKHFEQKVALLRHMELHTKEYECKICNQALHAFDFERHLLTNKHLRNVRNAKRSKRDKD